MKKITYEAVDNKVWYIDESGENRCIAVCQTRRSKRKRKL